MKSLYFVTSNENKIKEAETILKIKTNKIDLDIKEIQEIDVIEVVKDKAYKSYDSIKKPLLVDDSGIIFTTWNGFPGALVKWMIKTIGNKGICNILKNYNKTAVAKTCIGLYNGNELKIFVGEIKGTIPESPRGTKGFGWDSIFQPEGYDKTFAEMTQDEKNKISMRRIALIKMKEFLDSHPEFLK